MLENEHPFLLKLVRTFKDVNSVFFLTELVSGGELYETIRDLGILTKAQSQFYISSIILACQSLHDRRTVYRDLKPENTLLDSQGYVKIIDFGCAKKLDDTGLTFTVVGTPHYMAPEVILGRGYGVGADVWGWGVCLYEFLCGPLPFGNDFDEPMQVIQAVVTGNLEFPAHTQDQVQRSVMKGLLCRNWERRLGFRGADDVLAHDFFSDFSTERLLSRELPAPVIPKPHKVNEADCDTSLLRRVQSGKHELGNHDYSWADKF